MKPMNVSPERELMLKALEHSLTSSEEELLYEYFQEIPGLRQEYEEFVSLQEILKTAEKPSFKPFFEDRVIRRAFPKVLKANAQDFYLYLSQLFKRLALTAIVLAVLLGSYNILSNTSSTSEDSILETVFSIPSTTISAAAPNTTIISYQGIGNDNTN